MLHFTNQDGLLNEWGVHHFHLGTKPSPKDGSYIERTGPLVFALLTDADFYAINVYSHGSWEALTVLESLHRNWPQLLKSYRINGLPAEVLDHKARRKLRTANVQVFNRVSDGTTYGPMLNGVVCSGVSAQAVVRAARVSADVRRLQLAMQEQIETFVDQLRPGTSSDQALIKATLVGIDSQRYRVLFPEFHTLANITMQETSLMPGQ